MFVPFPAALVAIPFAIGVADPVPTFNLGAICTADSTRGSEGCVRSETAARGDLAKQWEQFPTADRTRCVQLATMSKMPSYVQVLTCLEMAREARQINAPAVQGQPPSARGQAPDENRKK